MKYDLNLKPSIEKKDVNPGMYSVIIYQLIRQYSNVNNKLTISDITDTLFEYWQGDKDLDSSKKNLQRTIKRNLTALMYLDSNISAEKKDGTTYYVEDGESPLSISKIWYEQDLTPTDLQLITDAIIFSKHFSNDKRREILNNLFHSIGESYSSKTNWFQTILKDAEDISVPVSTDLYRNLEFIHDAIVNQYSLSFDYCLSGPRGEKYTLMSFAGVSAYKIIHDNGIYYLVASRKTEKNSPFGIETIDPKEIITVEVHKLDKLCSDFNNEYVPFDETYGKSLNLQEFLSPEHHPARSQHFLFFFGENSQRPILCANAMGLDILIDVFGNRLTARKITENNTESALNYKYEVKLKGIIRYDWFELVSLCLRYPEYIKIKEPQALFQAVKTSIEKLDDYSLDN